MTDKVVSIHPNCDYERGSDSQAVFDVNIGMVLAFAEDHDIPFIVMFQDEDGDTHSYSTSVLGQGNNRRLCNLFMDLVPVPIEFSDE